MSINIREEKVLSLGSAAQFLASRGFKKPSTTSIWRWCREGRRGIKLESVWMSGSMYTTVEAIERFITSVSESIANSDGRGQPDIVTKRSPQQDTQRRYEIENAESFLDERGMA